ncbi:unnamed protein product [Rotaria sordida]|uniref:F-box domain-containing protein n=1 Tax=Rotaria sordida TaxID=392033 RepID=A0A815FDA5_9BILA|nr:unnamed protein product [Rotaria sordida]CAF1583751.1 unnamed protein product [Rotaria sordida]
MNERRSHLQDLPVELFHHIFEYLAPHDLLNAFKKLNRRFDIMLTQQPLCLPNNRQMSIHLYLHYLKKIVSKHASQIVYLHLSERNAPHAMNYFLSEIRLNNLVWSTLKAVTIEDIPRHVLEIFLYDCSFLSKIHSLSLDVGYQRFHCDEYNDLNYTTIFSENCPPMSIHRNLQSLSIVECSRELLIELLNNGHLPQLQHLRVAFPMTYANIEKELPRPIPLKQAFVPELRHVNIKIFGGVAWVLTFFEDLQRYSQLDQLIISGYERFADNSHFPRVTSLRQWLTLTKSNIFTFQLNSNTIYAFTNNEIQEEIFAEYRQATGEESAAKYGHINLSYPTMSFSDPLETNDNEWEDLDSSNDSTKSFKCVQDPPVDDHVEEMNIFELDYVEDERFVQLEAMPCWHHLKKINLEGDCSDDNGVVGENISHLLHIAQRSPYLRELHIESDLDYGRVLSSNKQLGILLSRQLEILQFTAEQANSSFGDLVCIIDKLFSYGQSPCRLQQLILTVDGHPDSWLSIRHLNRWLEKMFKRFPSLIRFTLTCKYIEACQNSVQNFSILAPEWYVDSLLSGKKGLCLCQYRYKPHSIEIWL